MKTLRIVLAGLAVTGLASIAAAQNMDSYWPNQDGLSWQYQQHADAFDDLDPPIDNQIRIFFDGNTVAPTAIAAQLLVEEFVTGRAPTTGLAASIPDPFMRALWQARPDLRERIMQAVEGSPCPKTSSFASSALLLGGDFAFVKSSDDIAAWRCNLADTRAWIWLVSNLSIGNTFTLQLVPDLADDVFLEGTIAQVEDVTVPAGTFADCLRVDYRVDYGATECMDNEGNITGSYHSETRGWVHYAPQVGPVDSYEEFVWFTRDVGNCAPSGNIDEVTSVVSLRLDAGPVPARPSTWGRIKAAYR